MDILDEIIDCFTLTIDKALMSNLKHNQATEMLNKFCTEELSEKQSGELNEIVGKLTSAIFLSAAKAGMKIGSQIAVSLLTVKEEVTFATVLATDIRKSLNPEKHL